MCFCARARRAGSGWLDHARINGKPLATDEPGRHAPAHHALEAQAETREETISGWKVKVTHTRLDHEEQAERRNAVAQVIGRSLKDMKD